MNSSNPIFPIQLALCDDQPLSLNTLREYTCDYFEQRGIPYEFHQFLTPSEAFAHIEKNSLHILFMDLEFDRKEEDGMDWTKKITDTFPDTLILILTAYENRYKEGYRAKAFRFMTKPLNLQELKENLDDCLERLVNYHTIRFMHSHTLITLAVKDITYIEAFVGGSSVHTVAGKIIYSDKSLLQFENELATDAFFRIHKRYLVNLDHVTDIIASKHEILLTQGIRLPVSRRKWTDFQGSYIRHDVYHA